MTTQEQIIVIAELDGWVVTGKTNCNGDGKMYSKDGNANFAMTIEFLPPYLTSRDAIISVIEKAIPVATAVGTAERMGDFVCYLANSIGDQYQDQYYSLIVASPQQLAEALLRATGKWKD